VSAPAVSAPLAQIPNALTILRLALIPVFVALLIPADGGYSWPAAIVFAVAGITDQVDGWLARRWHVESQFGKVADPLTGCPGRRSCSCSPGTLCSSAGTS
jgi:CDP-diacylglycerol--glycerol-3-phosphate 3-phosphatidyltransferase